MPDPTNFTFGPTRRFRSIGYDMVEMTPEECAEADRIEAARDKSNDPHVVAVDESTGTITLARPDYTQDITGSPPPPPPRAWIDDLNRRSVRSGRNLKARRAR